MYLQTYPQYYSTVLLYMCSKQEHKADHGHKKGHAPRAQEGRSFTGISRPRTEVLRTRAYVSAANTLLRSRASRGHLNLYFMMHHNISSRTKWPNPKLPRRRPRQPRSHRLTKIRKVPEHRQKLPRRSQKMLPWLTSRHASPEVNHPTQYITKSAKSRRLAYSACHASGRVFEIIILNQIFLKEVVFLASLLGAFKTRAAAIEKALAGHAVVKVNGEKPRKGCFEVRVNGKAVISLLDMPRPFPKVGSAPLFSLISPSLFDLSSQQIVATFVVQLKALDMEKVAADVIAAL